MKTLSLILGLMLMNTASFAEDKAGRRERGEHFQKELGLSDEQLVKVKEIKKSSRSEVKASKERFKELKKGFQEAMKDPKVSDDELTAKFETFQKARDEFQRKRFSMMLEMRKILTPEQLSKFHEMKQKRYHGKHKYKPSKDAR